MTEAQLDFYKRLAHALALQFGSGCEVVVHDLEAADPSHSIVAIENGHVTGRKLGDGPSHVVLEALHAGEERLEDRLAYLTKTADGKILKSSTVFIRDDHGRTVGIFAVNYDITILRAMGDTIAEVVGTGPSAPREPEPIVRSVADLLDDLIEQSVQLVGTPVALMTKEEKVRAIRYLNDTGAFLITKSGPKVCKYFGISKYTLYNYLDEARAADEQDERE
ncbi:transcriptional regulator [Olsenella sp. DSM 107455]|uniref:Transcriptional regulator n=1 Tax=Thermophilibacter gallinarum TaxID=2779357 RepID=A0ABR9QTB2_9ACTN|nr:helix-turn-helix transcriptional regulator [Thermophilibacter gallinarum]MBE5024214.1 transcriptional regulator [Thermophilibacter gallinarum]